MLLITVVDELSPDIPMLYESEDDRSYPSSKMDQSCPSVTFFNLAETHSFTYKIGITTS